MMFPIKNIDILITNVDDSTETVTLEAPNGDDPFVTHLERVITRRKFRDKNMFQRRGREDYKIRFVYNYASHEMDLRKFLGAKAIELKAPPSLSGDYTTYDVRFVNEEAVKNWFRNLPIASMPDDPTEADTIPSGEVTLEFETVVPLAYDDMNVQPIAICLENDGQLRLSWVAKAGASAYNLYISDDGENFTKQNSDPIEDLIYKLDPLNIPDGDYKVRIYPIMGGSESSDFSHTGEFELDQSLTSIFHTIGGFTAQSYEGDTLYIGLSFNYDGFSHRFSEINFKRDMVDFITSAYSVNPAEFEGEKTYTFDNRPESQMPYGWTSIWNNTDSWYILSDGTDKRFRNSSVSNARKAAVAHELGKFSDVEVYVEAQSDSLTSNQIRLALRVGTELDGSENLISVELFDGDTFQVFTYNATGSDSYAFNWSINTWYSIRARIIDNLLEARVWETGTPEPSNWQLSVQITNPFSETGFVGLSNFTSGARYFDNFYMRNLNGLTIPESPSGLSVEKSGSDLSFEWNSVAVKDGYNLYADSGNGFEKINDSLIVSESFQKELQKGRYKFVVKSVLDGVESYVSNTVSFDLNVVEFRSANVANNIVGTTVDSTIPNDVEVGDMLILSLMHRDVLTPPAGWTLIETTPGTITVNQRESKLYRIAQSGDAGSVVTSGQASSQRFSSHIQAFKKDGADPITIIEYEAVEQSASGLNLPEITSNDDWQMAVVSMTNVYAQTSGDTEILPPDRYAGTTPENASGNRLACAYKALKNPETISGRFEMPGTTDTDRTAFSLIIE